MIEKKNLEQLQILKIKHDLDEFPVVSNYLFILEKKCIFITKFRNKFYQVMASPQCKLANIDSQAVFNVIYTSNDLNECIKYFKDSIDIILFKEHL